MPRPRRGPDCRSGGLAQPFEDLRDAADRHRIATGDRPAAWVAALGSAAAHSARTAWAQNLLAAGGVEARGATGVDSPIAAAADFAASGSGRGRDHRHRRHVPPEGRGRTRPALTDAGCSGLRGRSFATPTRLSELPRQRCNTAGVDEFWQRGHRCGGRPRAPPPNPRHRLIPGSRRTFPGTIPEAHYERARSVLEHWWTLRSWRASTASSKLRVVMRTSSWAFISERMWAA